MFAAAATDLFATKGIEYLLVLGFLLLFLIYWRLLDRRAARTAVPARDPWFRLSKQAYYHPGHSWARLVEGGGEGTVRVGVDDFAQRLLGRPASLTLPEVGATLEQGSPGWRLEFGDRGLDLLSPVSGEVVARNEEVLSTPERVNEDPYGRAWLLEVRLDKGRADLGNLLSGEPARSWLESVTAQLRRRISGELGAVLQDGGVPVSGFARELSPDAWDEIAREFLLT